MLGQSLERFSKKLLVFGLVVALFLVCFSTVAQNFANGTGKGSLQKEIFWLTWDNGLVSKPNNATNNNLTAGSYTWQISPTIRVTANLNNIISVLANCKLASYTSGAFYGDGLDDLYPGVKGAGIITSVFGGQVKFNIAVTVEVLVSGVWQNLSYPGLVIGDAESMASTEFIKASTNSTDGWQLLDLRNDAFPSSKADKYLFTLANSSRDFTIALAPDAGDDIFVQAVFFAKGATQLTNVEMKGRGSSGVAIGVVVPVDFGDAPASFGSGAHIIDKVTFSSPPTISDGVYPITSIVPATLQTATNVFAGLNNVDADGNPPSGELANYDDTAGVNDENGFVLASQPAIKVNTNNGIQLQIKASNTKSTAATIYAWLDFDGNGIFTNAEIATATIGAFQNDQTITLSYPNAQFTNSIKAGANYLRIRITTSELIDDLATTNIDERSIGAALDGEIEDFKLNDKLGVQIAGGLFNDANGISDNLINGNGLQQLSAQQVYAYLVNQLGIIVQKQALSVAGKFQFTQVDNGQFSVALSVVNASIGDAVADVAGIFPSEWVIMGESWGQNNLAGTGIKTGTTNYTLQTTVITPKNSLDVSAIDFGLNKKPLAINDSVKTIINVPVPIGATANDSDFENALEKTTILLIDPADGQKKQSVTIPGVGTYTINPATAIVNFTPATGFVGKAPALNYVVKDKAGLESNIAAIVVWVYPVGVNDSDNTFLNTPVTTVVKNNDGPSGNNATVLINNQPSNGTAIVNPNGTVTYTPKPGFSGTDVYTYTITTPDGLISEPITVTITVSALPKPQGVADIDTTYIQLPITVDIKKNDGSTAQNTSLQISSQPTRGSVSLNTTGTITYTPNANFIGVDSLFYTLTNAEAVVSLPIKVTIWVLPTGTNDQEQTPVNTPVNIVIGNNDGPSFNLTTVQLTTQPINGTAQLNNNGTVTYVPKTDFVGKDSFNYILRTNLGIQSKPITVYVNVFPRGTDDIDSTFINLAIAIPVKLNDGAGTQQSAIIIHTPAKNGVALVGLNNLVNYTPNPQFLGIDSFYYQLQTPDGLLSSPIKVTVIVKPIAVADAFVTYINTPIINNVKANDGASSANTAVQVVTNPANGNITLNPNNTVNYTPNSNFIGRDTYTYQLIGAQNVASAPVTVTITVLPVAVLDRDTTLINTPLTVTVKLNDGASGLNTTVEAVTNPVNGNWLVNANNTILYTPNAGFVGLDSGSYRLSLGDGIISEAVKVYLVVRPKGVNDAETTPVNTPVTINVKANDGASALVTSVKTHTQPLNGVIRLNADGSYVYTPNNGFTGTDVFTYVLETGNGIVSDPITVSITVTPIVVVKVADVKIEKKLLSEGPIFLNRELEFLVTVTNSGPDAATNVMVYDFIQPNLEQPQNVQATKGSAGFNFITNSVVWSVGNLNNGEKAEIRFTAKVINGGQLSNAANVTANEPDPDLSNNTSAIQKQDIIEKDLVIPNVFTPNADGKNDFFVVKGLNAFPNSELYIYNRWDNLVYQSK
ncbi:MAG: CshA/CshB family fibrillar adhesin-related protein, partial [Chitinophagaceae bacterium]